MQTESQNRFDQELVGWFAARGGTWSGTASALLTAVKSRVDVTDDLWPRSASALYAYLAARKEVFRSLGVDVLLRDGFPRVISLRPSEEKIPEQVVPPTRPESAPPLEPEAKLPGTYHVQEENSSGPDAASAVPHETSGPSIVVPREAAELPWPAYEPIRQTPDLDQSGATRGGAFSSFLTAEVPTAELSRIAYEQSKASSKLEHKSVAPEAAVNPYLVLGEPQEIAASLLGEMADHEADRVDRRISETAVDALCTVLEMRVLIDKEGLDLRSAMNLVVARTKELSRADGVAVGLILQGAVTYPARAGVAGHMGGLHFQDNLFLSCFDTRRSVLMPDAQEHPQVGSRCREEGIASLLIVPIFHDREVAGGIELLFKDRRTFAACNVEDLELMADVIGEGLSGSAPVETKLAGGWGWRAEPKVTEKFEALRAGSSNETVASPRPPQPAGSANERVVSAGAPTPSMAPPQEASVTATGASELMLGLLASKLAAAPVRVSDAVKRAWARYGRGLGKVS